MSTNNALIFYPFIDRNNMPIIEIPQSDYTGGMKNLFRVLTIQVRDLIRDSKMMRTAYM